MTLLAMALRCGAIGGLALAACDGGGSGTVSTPPTVSATPTPTPAASASVHDTAEYRATAGAVAMNALAAYQRGAAGTGVKVAVMDSGFDVDDPDIAGRIDPASADVAGSRGVDDTRGHGSGVAHILAARRDGVGDHGIAFDATLILFRTDFPGTCAAGDCIASLAAIAEAVDRARLAGAKVINLSLIGDSAPTSAMLAAVDRATAAGMVLTICGGNDSRATSPQTWGRQIALSAEARGQVVLVGYVDRADVLLGSRAGPAQAHYLAAMGDACSATAPMVAGALALLAHANPGLSGAELLERLYGAARDGGTAGPDAVYGRGIVDLTRAFP
jgi:hypothetical protein